MGHRMAAGRSVAAAAGDATRAAPATAPAVQLWSGGKDSAMALWTARQTGEPDVQALATTVAGRIDRSTWHGVRTELMRRQAAAVGLPLHEVRLADPYTLDQLMGAIEGFLRSDEAAPYAAVVWGDLFWDEARRRHEGASVGAGKTGVYPLWGRETAELARAVIGAGFRAIVTSVDLSRLDASFAGRAYDAAFLAALPEGIDPCAEAGEFHTFVWDGPVFREPVPVRRVRVARRGETAYCDLAPAD